MKKEKKSIKISESEKAILREIVLSEKANIQAFGLPNRNQQVQYIKTLERLNYKLA
jgi:hypothetical protein